MRAHALTLGLLAVSTLFVLGGAPASARDLELSAGSSVLSAGSGTADAVTTDDLIPFGSLRLALELPEVGRGHFVELGWRVGTTQATDFQQIDAELEVDDFEVAYRVDRSLARFVRVFARAGAALTSAELTLDGGGLVLADTAYAWSGIAGAGVELVALRAGVLALGLRLEAGLRYSSALDFAPSPKVDGDDARIRTETADVGGMDLSGATVGISAVGRF